MSEQCPKCKKGNLLKRITLKCTSWECLNKPCDYHRELKAGEKKWTIQTKVKTYLNGKFISDDCVLIVNNSGVRENKTVLTINDYPYYLEDLMHLGKYSKDQLMQDKLYLDWGRKLYVAGMLEVYKEIINTLVLRGISV